MTQSVGDRGSHTPGPWEAVRDESHFDTLSTVVAGAVTRFPGRQMMVQVGGSCGVAEQEANARLIAAAPTIFEALEPFGEIDGEGDEDFPDDTKVTVKFGRTTDYTLTLGDFRRARSAIQSATGEG